MKKFLCMLLIIPLILVSGCQSKVEGTVFEFGEDLFFVNSNGNYLIDIENSSDVVKEKYAAISKVLTEESILDDIVATTTTTANILYQIGIMPTGAPESPSLEQGVRDLQYDLREQGKVDKNMVLNVGSALAVNVEAIIELNPSLVLYSDAMPNSDFLSGIEESDIRVKPLAQSDYIDMFVLLHRVNEITEFNNELAVQRMNSMVKDLQEVQKIVNRADEKNQTVAILQVAAGSTRINNNATVLGGITNALGLDNVFGGSANGELNAEQLMSANPDFIIYYSHGMSNEALVQFESELNSEDSVFRILDAVENGNVFAVSADDFIFSSSVDFDIIKVIRFLAEQFYE